MEFVFGWQGQPLGNFLVGLFFIIVIYTLLLVCVSKVVRRKSGLIITSVAFGITLATYLLNSLVAVIIVNVIFASIITIYAFANLGDLRFFIANPFRKTTAKTTNFGIERIFDRQTLYKQLEAAVIQLSNTRTGAIITFEKNTSLDDVLKNGVMVNAPVTSELLTTIFYPGTRLHDGAVVIRENMILAASVFYTPTTKPFAGKYGSRHRAAIGISEISDSVTVVVSEETGRISFAVNGQLDTVTQETFRRVFETYMGDASSNEDSAEE